MSDDITNLMQQIQNYFLHLYSQQSSVAPESTFLSFEPIGTPITDDMFKLNPSDTTYSRPLAVEQFSKLVNTISPINADVFQHTDRQVDDFYNILLAGAQLADSSADNTVFTTIKAEAMRRFEPTVGSLLDETPVPFHPSYPTPDDWYDMSNQNNWTTYTFNSSQTTIPPVVIHPPIVSFPPWNWRVIPEAARPILESPKSLQELIATPERAFILNPAPSVVSHPIINPAASVVTQPVISEEGAHLNPTILSTPLASTSSPLLREVSQPQLTEQVVSEHVNRLPIEILEHPLSPINEGDTPTKNPTFHINQSSLVAARLPLQIIRNTTPQPIISNSIQLTFEYCLVNVNRPWFSEAFLALQGWDVPGYAAGSFSTGTATENTGFFPAMPVAFLAVKDVQITANWTNDEFNVSQQSAAFGPFSLIGRTVDSTSASLSSKGTLIIGWICQIMAQLPPSSSPTNS